jgi:hypothetical protein
MNTAGVIHAVQHIRRLRGGTQSHLIRASDKNFYTAKFQNNPQHIRVLANEFLAGRIGRLLGLPMPKTKVIDVSEWLILNTPCLWIESEGLSTPCAKGLQLASRYAADLWTDYVFDYLPESAFSRVVNIADFARVLALDKWLGNCDSRQAILSGVRTNPLIRRCLSTRGTASMPVSGHSPTWRCTAYITPTTSMRT